MNENCQANTEREIFRERTQLTDDGLQHYESTVIVDAQQRIGMRVAGTGYSSSIREWVENVQLLNRFRAALFKMSHEIDQTLGKALGYPRYDDADYPQPEGNFRDEVCTGEHVPETLAAEAARRIRELEAELDEERTRRRMVLGRIRDAVRAADLSDGVARAAVGAIARSVEELSDETIRRGQALREEQKA